MDIYKEFFQTENSVTEAIEQAKTDYEEWSSQVEREVKEPIPAPSIHPIIKKIIDGEEWNFIDKTKKEYEEDLKSKFKLDLLSEYQSNPEKWRTEVIKPWSMQKLQEWIDHTYIQPLKYNLNPEQEQERIDKREELLVYHNQAVYTENPVKPAPPSWDKHPTLPDQ